jgi:Na+-driven multidrug efflux pump
MQDQGDDKSIIKIEEADENTQDGNAQLVESNLTQNTNTASKKEDWKNSILLKTITFGANGFFFAGHLVLNGKYLSTLGPYGASASSLMSTYQSVILGSGVGFLLGTGLDFGMALGKKEYETAGDVAKTATILSSILGGFSASAMFSTRGIFPLIFEANTAKIASDFFTGYAVASFPILFVIMGQQVALQEGDWYVPPASMLFILAGSGVSSYLLGFTADMGAIGIGLGGTVGSSLVAIGMGSWFFRKNYGKYNLYKCHVKGFSEKMKSLLSLGWKLAFQRLTEWGNLLYKKQ